jgi:hypothetical protein
MLYNLGGFHQILKSQILIKSIIFSSGQSTMYSFEVHDSDEADGRESSRSRTMYHPDFHQNYNEGRSSSVPPSLLQQQQQMGSNGQTRIGSPVAFRGGRPPPAPNGPRTGPWPPRSLSPRYYRPPPGFS